MLHDTVVVSDNEGRNTIDAVTLVQIFLRGHLELLHGYGVTL